MHKALKATMAKGDHSELKHDTEAARVQSCDRAKGQAWRRPSAIKKSPS